jgi:hypothetical protein
MFGVAFGDVVIAVLVAALMVPYRVGMLMRVLVDHVMVVAVVAFGGVFRICHGWLVHW